MSTETLKTETTEVKPTETKEETFSPSSLVGMEKDKASTAAKTAGYSTRVSEEDGEVFMGTMDYDKKRINLSVAKGVISKVKLG